ncbi:beta-lactamase family protein [Sinimarinibacterium sp. CAU 1509]|uniref:serine hydrolase domain-containing protein n=1 Tax=Sinimarinibacterium sp. CAU 1509 TaxID=2562283 RepID=UPI0010ABE543|nr:serine hydrolase domain-containing protein [Sinimarinibacterium sp. CAU 1509]TJY64903.1 beta-lactamase family protein [Sinimarinibacterium sp. CAU 1509]
MALGLVAMSQLVTVPKDLSVLSRIDHAAECRPEEAGMSSDGVARIWRAVQHLYRSGLQPAITLVLRRGGKVVMKRSIGAVRGNGPGESGPIEVLQPDSPICLFSASKAVTALLVHQLAEQGKLKLDDRVVDYIPEFGAHGKDRVTIRALLAHRAGIPKLPIHHPDPSLLRHWDAMVHMLCLAPPFDPRFEKQAYHALTSGFIIGELVQRVSGRPLREVLRTQITEPLGLRYLDYGLAPELRHLAPRHHLTGPTPGWPLTAIAKRVLGVDFARAVSASNDEAYLSSVVPAGNIFASADDIGRIFQMLLDRGSFNGVQVMQPHTVAESIRPAGGIQFDGTLGLPLRFSPGFMLGESPVGLWGPNCKSAFGHIGFMTVLCWADPQRDISVAMLNTGKSVSPTGLLRTAALVAAITRACPPV